MLWLFFSFLHADRSELTILSMLLKCTENETLVLVPDVLRREFLKFPQIGMWSGIHMRRMSAFACPSVHRKHSCGVIQTDTYRGCCGHVGCYMQNQSIGHTVTSLILARFYRSVTGWHPNFALQVEEEASSWWFSRFNGSPTSISDESANPPQCLVNVAAV